MKIFYKQISQHILNVGLFVFLSEKLEFVQKSIILQKKKMLIRKPSFFKKLRYSAKDIFLENLGIILEN